jgi:hypothetical protein
MPALNPWHKFSPDRESRIAPANKKALRALKESACTSVPNVTVWLTSPPSGGGRDGPTAATVTFSTSDASAPSLEKPFWNAFARGLAGGFGMICFIVMLAMGPDYQAVPTAGGVGLLVAVFYLLIGLTLLGKAYCWARRGGAVQRLVAHARGRACGSLAAIPCQLGIVIMLRFAK